MCFPRVLNRSALVSLFIRFCLVLELLWNTFFARIWKKRMKPLWHDQDNIWIVYAGDLTHKVMNVIGKIFISICSLYMGEYRADNTNPLVPSSWARYFERHSLTTTGDHYIRSLLRSSWSPNTVTLLWHTVSSANSLYIRVSFHGQLVHKQQE